MRLMSTRVVTMSHPLRRVAVLAAVLILAWLLAACSSSGEEASYSGSDAGGAAGEPPHDGAVGEEGGGDVMSTSADGREYVITGAMYMTVEDPIFAAGEAASIVERAGGRVDARSERAASDYEGGWAQLRLRIPAGDLDAVTDELRGLGTVDELSTDSVDVTREVEDLNARVSTLRASTTRIEALLADAEDIADIITLEDELASRQAELESLEARQRGLADQVAMSTIDLSLTTEPVVIVDDAPRSFWDGLVSGWNALTGFVAGALVVIGVLLPWLAVGAAIALVVVLLVRREGSRRAARASAAAPAPTSSLAVPAPAAAPAAEQAPGAAASPASASTAQTPAPAQPAAPQPPEED